MTEVYDLLKDKVEKSNQPSDMAEESDDSQLLQPSRSGITSTFLIDRANRGRNSQVTSDSRPTSFVRTDVTQPVFPSRTNNWQEGTRRSLRLQSRSPRLPRNSTSNFTVIDIGSRTQPADSNDSTQLQDDAFNEESEEASSRAETSARDEERPRLGVQMSELRRRDLVDNRNYSTGNVELHVSSADVWEALVAFRETRSRRERGRELHSSNEWRDWMASRTSNPINVNLPRSYTVVITGQHQIRASSQNRQGQHPMYALTRNENVHQNIPRLTHYIEEPNVGSGYIKELCFSADGRVICSPFGYGVRLLAFSNQCQELSDCVPPFNESVQLHELATSISHTDIVVSTKFSPRHCLLVSGCLSGKIFWHQPVI